MSSRFGVAVTVVVIVVALATLSAGSTPAEAEDSSIFHWARGHQNKNNLDAAIAFFSAVYPNLFPEEGAIHERSVTDSDGGTTGSNGRSIWATIATFLPMLISQRDDESIHTLPFNITDLLRMVGVDSDKIGTMVINAIVYVIELVSNHFFGGSNAIEGRKLDTPGSVLLFLFDKRIAEDFVKRISDPELPNTVISNLQRSTGNDTICIQQLICKMSPFWWGVNQSVRDLLPFGKKTKPIIPNIGWVNLLKKYVPSLKEFSFNSDLCETRFPGCVVMTHPRNEHWMTGA